MSLYDTSYHTSMMTGDNHDLDKKDVKATTRSSYNTCMMTGDNHDLDKKDVKATTRSSYNTCMMTGDDRDLDKVKTTRSKLIVNYLPQCTTEGELRNLFGAVGALESANVIRDKVKGHSLQYGFVSYVDPCDAAKAIDKLNRHKLHDKTIKVSYARPSSEDIQDSNIYVCNLPKTMTLEAVEQMFSPYGRIINSSMPADAEGNPRGVAFIRFDKRSEAQEATRRLNGTTPPGASEEIKISKPILCKGPDSKGKGHDSKGKSPGGQRKQDLHQQLHQVASGQRRRQGSVPRIFIHNLDQDADEDLLSNMFANFGTVTDVKVIRDFRTKKCRGLAFVTMANYEEAINAISGLNGFRVGNNTLQVSFGKVEEAPERRSRERTAVFRPHVK